MFETSVYPQHFELIMGILPDRLFRHVTIFRVRRSYHNMVDLNVVARRNTTKPERCSSVIAWPDHQYQEKQSKFMLNGFHKNNPSSHQFVLSRPSHCQLSVDIVQYCMNKASNECHRTCTCILIVVKMSVSGSTRF